MEKANGKGKKRAAKRKEEKKEESSESEMSVSEAEDETNQNGSSSDEEMDMNDPAKNINVDFEAFTPEENDFHGLKQLLLRPLVTLHVDVSDMSDLIISQKNMGSTIKIVDDDEDNVYGIVTMLHLDLFKDRPCIKEMKKELLKKCKCKDTAQKFGEIFSGKRVGFLINERFINLPDQIALPFHNSIQSELEEIIKQDKTFDVDYLLMIAKTMRPTKGVPVKEGVSTQQNTSKRKGKKKKTKHVAALRDEDEVDYTNFEEELYFAVSNLSFSYCVTDATGFAVGGEWDYIDQPMNTYRTVFLLHKRHWKSVLKQLNSVSS